MKTFLSSNIGRLRLLAIIEGFSLLILVFVSVPLKQIYGVTTLSSILGPVHGILFLLFVMNTISVGTEQNWKFKQTTWKVLLACIIPFGTFYIDNKILKPLHVASYYGHEQIVKYLFENGAKINKNGFNNESPLYVAAYKGDPKVVAFLTEKGADVNIKKTDGTTPLLAACQEGHLKIATMLINAGANINSTDNHRASPLHRAASGGHKDIVEKLLANGADPSLKNRNGKTAYDLTKDPEIKDLFR